MINVFSGFSPKRCKVLVSSSNSNASLRCFVSGETAGKISYEILETHDYDSTGEHEEFHCSLGFYLFQGEYFLVLVSSAKKIGIINEKEVFQILSVVAQSLSSDKIYRSKEFDPEMSSEGMNIIELLANGEFFFSNQYDLTRRLQDQIDLKSSGPDNDYIWNNFLLKPFSITSNASATCFFSECIRGFVGFSQFKIADNELGLTVISRVASSRAGTRFLSRGIDDDGNVSNFVESETILCTPEGIFSYVIVRGSVPVFWEQQGAQIGSQSIRLTRSSNATQPAFDRHFSKLCKKYGLIHVVDLLCQKDNHVEYTLSNAFEFHLKQLTSSQPIQPTSFDFNSICGKSSLERLHLLSHYINKDLQLFGFFYYDYNSEAVLRTQKGVFRVNCLDCLDRTNVVQEFISRKVIEIFMRSYLIFGENGTLLREHSSIWADNGDVLSIIYAGTKALKTSFTRTGKMGIFAIVDDMTKSAKRAIVHNFMDKDKQRAIDDLLGLTAVLSQNQGIIDERISFLNVRVFSWNTGSCSISPSLLRESDFFKSTESTDVFVFALQEIVQLNASQIVSTDPERLSKWTAVFEICIKESCSEKSFSLLAANHLVGTAIIVFVESNLLSHTRNVLFASMKTGLRGMVGNKGSIALRMQIYNNSFCFITSHLAAGQGYAPERDRELGELFNNLEFAGGMRILDHEFILLAGDLNYRIDTTNETAREMVRTKELDVLLSFDQLRLGLLNRDILTGFKEAPIRFPPTYKYDIGTNIFDSSDKMRIPSWTDRILYKSNNKVKIQVYDSANLDSSDHKPVYAFLKVGLT